MSLCLTSFFRSIVWMTKKKYLITKPLTTEKPVKVPLIRVLAKLTVIKRYFFIKQSLLEICEIKMF